MDILYSINQIIVILSYTWPLIFVLLLAYWKIKWRNWPVEAIIIEKRGSNLVKTNDRCGKYTDRDIGLVKYRFLKSKDTIPVINYEWVLVNNVVHTNILERIIKLLRPTVGTIFLFRYGTKQYKPIEIKENGKNKMLYKIIKDKKGSPIIINQYEQFDPRDKMKILDFEVQDWDNMNFMVQEQRSSADRRRSKSEWLKSMIVPLGIIGLTVALCIITIKFSFDYASEVRSSAASGGGSQSNNQPKSQNPVSNVLPAN